MLSPCLQQKLSPDQKLVNRILQLLIQIQIKAQSTQQKYQNNVKYLTSLNQEILLLDQENKKLSEIELILSQCCQMIEIDQGRMFQRAFEVENENQNTSLSFNQQQKQTQKEMRQSIIEVIVPKLENLQQYFKQMNEEELVDKYLELKMMEKAEQMKHNEQVGKLQQKLQTVDQNLSNALAVIKNQRKQF